MSTEADDNLDEFLNLLEDGSQDQEDGAEATKNAEKSPEKDLSKLTYEDVFGSPSPEKKRRKVDDGGWVHGDDENESSSQCSGGESTKRKLFGDISTKPPKIAGGLDTSQYIIDYFSRIRLYKTSLALYCDDSMTPESVLKDRNMGLQYVSLMSMNLWYRTKRGDNSEKNIWTSGVLARKQGSRKSAKGNEYLIWEINDLKELEKSWTVYLFSGAATSSSLSGIPIGSLIDLTSPSIMADGKSNSGALKLSVNSCNQVRVIGTAKDFGYCRSKRKDGKDCTSVVNTWECDVCVYHASAELKKLNYKKNKSAGAFSERSKFKGYSKPEPQQEGVTTINFGGKPVGRKPASSDTIFGGGSNRFGVSDPIQLKSKPQPAPSNIPPGLKNLRMELQGTSVCSQVKRNALAVGNSPSISFKQEKHSLLQKDFSVPAPSKAIDLNPIKTRHLTEKDREILAALNSSKDKTEATSSSESEKSNSKSNGKKKSDCNSVSSEIASQIIQNPSAGSLNLMKYLSKPEKYSTDGRDPLSTKRPSEEPTLTINRKTMSSMKKALDYVKSKGPIKKIDPNATKKKTETPIQTEVKANSSSSRKPKIEVEFDFESDDFKQILNAKSAHEETVNDLKEEEYFKKLTMKEAIENKLLNTFSVATTAAMCRQCKYVALSQSDYCKEQGHQIRVVKATKRFFKCNDCGNRTMSLDRLPKRRKLNFKGLQKYSFFVSHAILSSNNFCFLLACKVCNSSSWIAAPLGKEKKGPVLPSEVLAIRGNEEKFIGSAGSKLFLNLEV